MRLTLHQWISEEAARDQFDELMTVFAGLPAGEVNDCTRFGDLLALLLKRAPRLFTRSAAESIRLRWRLYVRQDMGDDE